MTIQSIVAFVAVILLATPALAQTCRTDSIQASAPTSRYVINADGTVTDKETKIIWMRCALGQQWDGHTCTGKVSQYNWQKAVEAVAKVNQAKYGGVSTWRLPYVPELASIVERQCFDPRVNLVVFPATPSIAFWTGMERMGHPDMAYIIDFGAGEATPSKKTYAGPIRLMHDGPDGPWWTPPKMPGAK
jgi:hypothetical protein